ncbi:Crp/Fnr family transcriptional regulator [Peribacillus cavernae]|uniref:Crp/Fnr family transcriptional regulator n=1 Tax=Peribacillus cavernae TaxID=1674310 RepID=A0A3S0VVM8_9BACI|nr:Crp/Fnr family transcriptional regulator [Peribacillus cavernae]MDQ0219556.1 CRP-like cAMP-binding protein [Peribacillus cavernae]RUQ27037.1 Crp/Fnr family transcriptional regulator [Peribacillus cavernae]
MEMQHVVDEAFHPRRFGPLPPEVSELVTSKLFSKGSIIILQGEPAWHFFYVQTGHVRATIVRQDGIEKVLAFAEPGQFFADVPFFQQSNHWYTCEAVESTEVRVFSKEVMEKINRVRPDFIFTLMKSMAHKVWMLSNQMMTITFDPSEVRLARILVEMITRKPEGTQSLTITHQELSSLMGTSRVMVTRVLNGWKARGIVDLRKGSLSFKDLPWLEQLAAFGID